MLTDDRNYMTEQTERLRRRLYVSGVATGPDEADRLIAEASKRAAAGLGTVDEVVEAIISALDRIPSGAEHTERLHQRTCVNGVEIGAGEDIDAAISKRLISFGHIFADVKSASVAVTRAPKQPKRGNTRRSRQVRSTRARARRRVEHRCARHEVVEFEVLGHKFTARRDRRHAVESIVRDRIERATPRGAW